MAIRRCDRVLRDERRPKRHLGAPLVGERRRVDPDSRPVALSKLRRAPCRMRADGRNRRPSGARPGARDRGPVGLGRNGRSRGDRGVGIAHRHRASFAPSGPLPHRGLFGLGGGDGPPRAIRGSRRDGRARRGASALHSGQPARARGRGRRSVGIEPRRAPRVDVAATRPLGVVRGSDARRPGGRSSVGKRSLRGRRDLATDPHAIGCRCFGARIDSRRAGGIWAGSWKAARTRPEGRRPPPRSGFNVRCPPRHGRNGAAAPFDSDGGCSKCATRTG